MEIFYAVCAGLFIVICSVVGTFFIMTLVQVRQTAVAVQILAENANRELARIQPVSQAASAAASLLSGSLGGVASVAVQIINGFLKGREKSSQPAEEKKAE